MADGRFVGSVGTIGLGYVGLPLAAAFAEAGLSVVGIKRDPDKVAALRGGESYVEDVPSARPAPLVSSGLLKATEDYSALGEPRAILSPSRARAGRLSRRPAAAWSACTARRPPFFAPPLTRTEKNRRFRPSPSGEVVPAGDVLDRPVPAPEGNAG